MKELLDLFPAVPNRILPWPGGSHQQVHGGIPAYGPSGLDGNVKSTRWKKSAFEKAPTIAPKNRPKAGQSIPFARRNLTICRD